MVLLSKMGSVIRTLGILAKDRTPSHKEDRDWAAHVFSRITGADGFIRLVFFALDADFGVATYLLTARQDKSNPDIALCASEALECVEVCQALFYDFGAFDPHVQGTFTNALLRGLRQVKAVTFGGREGEVGWPTAASSDLLEKPAKYARSLFNYAKSFFDLNFPHYSWQNRFSLAPGCAR